VPKNSFGNVDLYQLDMCPIGAVHIPIQGIAKIARKLEIDFAEAVVRRKSLTYVVEPGILF